MVGEMSLLWNGLKSVEEGTSKAKSVGDELVDTRGGNGMSMLTGTAVGGGTPAEHVRISFAVLLVVTGGPGGNEGRGERQKREGSARSSAGVGRRSFENKEEVEDTMGAVSFGAAGGGGDMRLLGCCIQEAQ